MNRMEENWRRLRESGAVWMHSRDPKAPHVVLRSGKHSNGFIDTLQYLSQTEFLQESAEALAIELQPLLTTQIDWVIGSPMAGVQLAAMVGMEISSVQVGFNEKKSDTELICRFDMKPGSKVLLVEEMSTTGGTPQRGINAILAKNPEVEIVPYVGAYLIRCSRTPPELTSAQFVPVIELPEVGVTFEDWDAATCPLCAAGSKAVKNPKKVWVDLLKTMVNPSHEISGAEYA